MKIVLAVCVLFCGVVISAEGVDVAMNGDVVTVTITLNIATEKALARQRPDKTEAKSVFNREILARAAKALAFAHSASQLTDAQVDAAKAEKVAKVQAEQDALKAARPPLADPEN